jgi:hypothetical protein
MRRLDALRALLTGPRAPACSLPDALPGSAVLQGGGRAVRLGEAELAGLSTLLTDLRVRRVEVYSRPDYVLTWQTADGPRIVSFFIAEALVYPGDFTGAWTKRMLGEAVAGGRLRARIIAALEDAVSRDRAGR